MTERQNEGGKREKLGQKACKNVYLCKREEQERKEDTRREIYLRQRIL